MTQNWGVRNFGRYVEAWDLLMVPWFLFVSLSSTPHAPRVNKSFQPATLLSSRKGAPAVEVAWVSHQPIKNVRCRHLQHTYLLWRVLSDGSHSHIHYSCETWELHEPFSHMHAKYIETRFNKCDQLLMLKWFLHLWHGTKMWSHCWLLLWQDTAAWKNLFLPGNSLKC